MSASTHSTQDVVGPSVVNKRAFRAFDMAALLAFWFSFLCLSASSCDTKGCSKSSRRMVTLANRLASGPDCVLATALRRAAAAALPSRPFGRMKPRAMRL